MSAALRLALHRRAHSVAAERHRVLVAALRTGLRRESAPAVEALLHPDVVVLVDRGDDAGRALARVRGADVGALVLLALVAGSPVPDIAAQSVNGQQGLVFRQGQQVIGVLCATTVGRSLGSVWVVVNPAKLQHWN